MTARLTIDQVRVGDRVICADDRGWLQLKTGATYTVVSKNDRFLRFAETQGGWGVSMFIPAPALPAMTTELVEALREWGNDVGSLWPLSYTSEYRLFGAIKRAGILAPPAPEPPRLTDVQPTLQWEWLL